MKRYRYCLGEPVIHPVAMTTDAPRLNAFQPHQIVYLACDQSRLYTEVIEILADRRRAWVRPLVLVTPEETLPLAASSLLGLGDFQGWPDAPMAPDLLWPLEQFYPALDTDFVDLLAMLPAHTAPLSNLPRNGAVSQFTRRLWEVTGVHAQPDPS
jgi:hypothetical protein